ncbi:MAG: nuclear transport factor 2 family protein [Bryobacterales bacterium]|nr:nuclear transport factor 2 family protein [Bryobacterales bacterium]
MAIVATGQTATKESAAAAEVLALEKKIEDAVVRGDVAFVDSVLATDFSFVHGDAWTTGGKPLATDDKAAFLKRVASKEYLVHDLDGVKAEVHGDLVITYGRYVSLFTRQGKDAAPGKLNSIWFERVYAKRNGQWQFLSHRTVHGPTVAPAGVDCFARGPVRSACTVR